MQAEEFRASLSQEEPPNGLPATLAALWWDAKGDWARAHALVDELETPEGMAVHAYLHRKEASPWLAVSGPQSKNHCTIVEAFDLIPSRSRL